MTQYTSKMIAAVADTTQLYLREGDNEIAICASRINPSFARLLVVNTGQDEETVLIDAEEGNMIEALQRMNSFLISEYMCGFIAA
jgi:hypothetical protein